MKRKPDGSVNIKVLSNGTEVVIKKIDGKWIHQKKYPNGYVDKWGNFSQKGRGESSVIGKSGPRPELRKLCHGVGINDIYISQFTKTKVYQKWNDMLSRCYARNTQKQIEKYIPWDGCSIDSRWHKLSTFKEWVEHWEDYENKELDKDILVPGNKVYGPDTCLIVRPIVNSWFKPNVNKNGLPQGVSFINGTGRYRAQINLIGGKRTHLGYFDTLEEAFDVYLQKWKEQILVLMEQEKDVTVKNALIQYTNKHQYSLTSMLRYANINITNLNKQIL